MYVTISDLFPLCVSLCGPVDSVWGHNGRTQRQKWVRVPVHNGVHNGAEVNTPRCHGGKMCGLGSHGCNHNGVLQRGTTQRENNNEENGAKWEMSLLYFVNKKKLLLQQIEMSKLCICAEYLDIFLKMTFLSTNHVHNHFFHHFHEVRDGFVHHGWCFEEVLVRYFELCFPQCLKQHVLFPVD